MGKIICSKAWCYVWKRLLHEMTALQFSAMVSGHPHPPKSLSLPHFPCLSLPFFCLIFLLLSSLWVSMWDILQGRGEICS